MSNAIHLKQWKSAGRRFPCCKTDDSKETYKRRNKIIRKTVRVKLLKDRHEE